MDPVEEIKGRLSIEDLVGRYVDLKRSGASFKGLCPFHGEKTPSFYVTPSRGSFHCFGCGRGGDVFTFIMEMERLPFPDALKRLAETAGITLPERQTAPSLKSRLYEANALAAAFFADTLRATPGERARRYLDQRKFGSDAYEPFQLGYAPQARDLLVQHLRRSGFDDRILLAAGLALQDDSGAAARDRFRGRLMFPIRDAGGKVSGFGGRAIEEDHQPKYLNSPQTEIFDKSSVLFGIHLAGEPIRRERQAVLVEGYLDAVRAHCAGFRDTVASLGTAVTTQQLTGLSRWTETVVLALDPDPAGQAATARTALSALAEVTQARGRQSGKAGALDLRVARLPDGRDPDELIRDAPDSWKDAIAASTPAFDFFYAQTMSGLDRTSDSWRQESVDRLLPLIQQFSGSAGWQAVWLQKLAQDTGIDLRALLQSIPSAQPARRQRRAPPSGDNTEVVAGTTSRALVADPLIGVERALTALLLKIVVVPERAAEQLKDASFERPEHREIVNVLLDWRHTGNYDYQMLQETIPESLRDYADELHASDTPLPDDGKISVAVALHLARLQRLQLKAQLDRATQVLGDVSAEDKAAGVANLADMMSRIRAVEELLDGLSKQMMQSRAAS